MSDDDPVDDEPVADDPPIAEQDTPQRRVIRGQVHSAERRAEALAYRKQGYTYAEIGEAMQCSPALAHKFVMRSIRDMLYEDTAEVRRLELERLDTMMSGLWPQATAGDGHAVDAVIKLMDRRARYLGIDAPTRVAHTNPDGTPATTELRLIRVEIQGDPEIERYRQIAEAAQRPAGDLQ